MQGLHLTADLHGCAADRPLMTDTQALRTLCLAAVGAAGLQPVGELFHRFTPAGGAAVDVNSPAGITGKDVSTPAGITGKDVSTPAGITGKDVCTPVGITGKDVCTPAGITGKDVCTPVGITGVVLLAESHLAVHTWPEIAAVTLDVYVCNLGTDNTASAHSLMAALVAAFEPTTVEQHALNRGRAVAAA